MVGKIGEASVRFKAKDMETDRVAEEYYKTRDTKLRKVYEELIADRDCPGCGCSDFLYNEEEEFYFCPVDGYELG